MMFCLQVLFFFTLFATNFAQTCNTWLDTTRGFDTPTCGQSVPCKSLRYVLNIVNSTCQTNIISIQSGIYSGIDNEDIVLPLSNCSFIFLAVSPGTVTFQANNTVSIISINRGWTANVIFQGIRFTRTVTKGPSCVSYNSYGNLKFIDCEFINWKGNNSTVDIRLDTTNPSTVEFTRVSFVNNTVDSLGAAISISAGTQSPQYSQYVVTITNCIFNSNKATGIGGAVHLEGVNSTIYASYFMNNIAGMDGGALYVNTGSLLASYNSFFNNNADGSGGALYLNLMDRLSLFNSSIEDNSAKVNGGGIYVSMTLILRPDSKITLDSLSIKQNQAQGDGGGIWIASTVPEPGLFFFSLKNLDIEYNKAIGGSGGGFYITNEGLLMISYSVINYNYANQGGGGHCDGTTRVSGMNVTYSNNRANNTCLNDISGICYGFSSPCAQKQQQNNCNECEDSICSFDNGVHCFVSGADSKNPICLCSSSFVPNPSSVPNPANVPHPAPFTPGPDNSKLGWIIGGSIVGLLVIVIFGVMIISSRKRRIMEYEPISSTLG